MSDYQRNMEQFDGHFKCFLELNKDGKANSSRLAACSHEATCSGQLAVFGDPSNLRVGSASIFIEMKPDSNLIVSSRLGLAAQNRGAEQCVGYARWYISHSQL